MQYTSVLARRKCRVEEYLSNEGVKIPKLKEPTLQFDLKHFNKISIEIISAIRRNLKNDLEDGSFSVHEYYPDIKNRSQEAKDKYSELLEKLKNFAPKDYPEKFVAARVSSVFKEIKPMIQIVVYGAMDVDSIDNNKEKWLDFKQDFLTVIDSILEEKSSIAVSLKLKNDILNILDDIVNTYVGVIVINMLEFTSKLPDLSEEQLSGNLDDIHTIKAAVQKMFLGLLLDKDSNIKWLLNKLN